MSQGVKAGQRGYFITVDGIEGAGKSTQVRLIAEYLAARGQPVVKTREPGGTELGEAIRELLLCKQYPPMAGEAELLLIFAARAEHLDKVINPALKAGKYVVCDRFTDASYAYQGAGRGIPRHRIETLEYYVQGILRPDLTLLLDAPVSVALSRVNHRDAADRFESENQAFFEAVRQGYLELAKIYKDRIRVIDATQPVDQVAKEIQTYLEPLLP